MSRPQAANEEGRPGWQWPRAPRAAGQCQNQENLLLFSLNHFQVGFPVYTHHTHTHAYIYTCRCTSHICVHVYTAHDRYIHITWTAHIYIHEQHIHIDMYIYANVDIHCTNKHRHILTHTYIPPHASTPIHAYIMWSVTTLAKGRGNLVSCLLIE
jgi:hypothetical protein